MEKHKNEWKDWVEDLFAPSFDITVKDILEDKSDDTEIKSRIKRLSAFDPDAIRKVYERVRMMAVLDQEMKEQSSGCSTSKELHSPKPLEEKQTDLEPVDLNNSCIWDSDEISVLRDVYKSLKAVNIKLEVKCKELEKRNMFLETKACKLEADCENKAAELTERKKANTRLKIHCDTLQEDLDHATACLTAMEEIFQELSEEKSKMVKEMHELRVQRDKDRMDLSALELKLQSVIHQMESEKIALEEKVKNKYQSEINNLQSLVEKMTADLHNEKRVHDATKRGLNHLRSHFASLPVSNIIPPNAVSKDQVSRFDYG